MSLFISQIKRANTKYVLTSLYQIAFLTESISEAQIEAIFFQLKMKTGLYVFIFHFLKLVFMKK